MDRVDIGNPNTFAVSLKLFENYHGVWLYGHMCYWISGKMVGNFIIVTFLRDVLGQMSYIVKDSGKRVNDFLFEAEAKSVFHSLNLALYDQAYCPSSCRLIDLPDDFAMFDARIPVQSFDGWKIFAIENGKQTKLIFRANSEQSVSAVTIPYGEFDAALFKTHQLIDSLLELEEKKAYPDLTPKNS